jgi:hypothetical protein
VTRSPFVSDSQRREDAIGEAWQHYRETLEGMTGKAYDNAEERAWDELQRDLADIERLYTPLSTY